MRTEDLRRVLEPAVAECGADLEDVEVSPAGKRRRIRVIIDRDGGIDLDAVAAVSQSVSAALDASDVMGESPYVLEVTSPGVDRPLTEPRHWRRSLGRLVECELADGSVVTGRIMAADDEHVVLQTPDDSVDVRMGELRRGRVQVEFSRSGASAGQPDEAIDEGEE